MKVCRKCNVSKDADKDYGPAKNTKDKKQVWCAACRREYALERYNKNKNEFNQRRRQYYAEHERNK